jgi:hypothetical protein
MKKFILHGNDEDYSFSWVPSSSNYDFADVIKITRTFGGGQMPYF